MNRVFASASPEYQNTIIPHTTKQYSGFFAQKRHLRQRTGNCRANRGVSVVKNPDHQMLIQGGVMT
jgi:hypothetical protein